MYILPPGIGRLKMGMGNLPLVRIVSPASKACKRLDRLSSLQLSQVLGFMQYDSYQVSKPGQSGRDEWRFSRVLGNPQVMLHSCVQASKDSQTNCEETKIDIFAQACYNHIEQE